VVMLILFGLFWCSVYGYLVDWFLGFEYYEVLLGLKVGS
jgi:hypothetical protein